MPTRDNHAQPRRISSAPTTPRTASASPRPHQRLRRGRVTPVTATSAARRVATPATVWVPPAHATGPAWTDWVHATLRAAFLRPGGCWWDMTAALSGLSPADQPGAVPAPFWAGLIEHASRQGSTPTGPAAAALHTPRLAPAGAWASIRGLRNVTAGAAAAPAPGSVEVAFADLCASGETVDGRIGMLAATALRGGGILAVLTRCHDQPGPPGAPGPLVDPTGAIVAAAQNADLLYLQHIVIPTRPLTPPHPSPTLSPAVSPPEPSYRGNLDTAGHRDITHVDLLVFAKPHSSRVCAGDVDDRPPRDRPAACDPVSAQESPR